MAGAVSRSRRRCRGAGWNRRDPTLPRLHRARGQAELCLGERQKRTLAGSPAFPQEHHRPVEFNVGTKVGFLWREGFPENFTHVPKVLLQEKQFLQHTQKRFYIG